ncbi:TMEM175 family protein [uncultured Methanosphaera sp.]|uniref:TMEM175 family protein n=1 Tax=uncultured Methanosphaera sp. TaxID=262501 RepID=UPI000DC5D914|nr:TMEM175 family protein [uncultured Methanosphaera sp.]RAP45403.1 MAG: hypothetical protein BZ134_01210 [Methanosphaera sp. SHI1033]
MSKKKKNKKKNKKKKNKKKNKKNNTYNTSELLEIIQQLTDERDELNQVLRSFARTSQSNTKQRDSYHDNRDAITKKNLEKFSQLNEEQKHNLGHDKVTHYNNHNQESSFLGRLRDRFSNTYEDNTGRTMALTDGIFGMVMTLLAFSIKLPDVPLRTVADFTIFLQQLLPSIGMVLISFIIASSFWLFHHEFIKVNKVNAPFLWLNLGFLATISFIPFSTSVIANYGAFALGDVVFGINIAASIIMFLLMFEYAANKGFIPDVNKGHKFYIFNTFYIMMLFTVLISVLEFLVSPNFIYLFFLVPVIFTLRDIRYEDNTD